MPKENFYIEVNLFRLLKNHTKIYILKQNTAKELGFKYGILIYNNNRIYIEQYQYT